jgi:hypothetical protein
MIAGGSAEAMNGDGLNHDDSLPVSVRNDSKFNLGSFSHSVFFTAAVIVSLACLYWPLLSGQKAYFISDHAYYFEPFSRLMREGLRDGRLPLWNPYLFCGMSQIAVPSPGMFYPGTWLYALLPYSQALSLQMLGQQALAALGMFLLVSSFGWGFAPAAVAALVASLTGYMFSLTANFTLAATASTLPMVLWCFRSIAVCQAINRRTALFWFMAAASLSIYLFIAAGRPEIFVPGTGLLIAFLILDGINNRHRGIEPAMVWSSWRWQVLAFCTGTLMSLPVILPLLEWVQLSPRAHGLSLSHIFMWSTNWYDLACMIFPQPFGDLLVLGAPYLGIVATRPVFIPYLTSAFIGPICLTLAIWGFFDKNWAWRLWVGLCIGFFLICCLGEYTPIAPLVMQTFPALAVFRYPIKWLIFPIICLAIAAARGTQISLKSQLSKKAWITTAVIWIIFLGAGIAFLILGANHIYLLFGKTKLPSQAVMLLGKPMAASSVLGLLTIGWGVLLQRGRLTARNAAIIAIVGLATNLLVVALLTMQMTTDADFYQKTPVLKQWLDQIEPGSRGRILNLYFDPVSCPSNYRFKPGATWTVSFYAYCRDLLLCNTCMDTKTSNAFGYEAAETGTYREMLLSALHRSDVDAKQPGVRTDVPLYRLCQSTATEWVTTQISKSNLQIRVLAPKYFAIARESKEQNMRLYRVIDASPRCFFSPCWQWVDAQAQIADRLEHADQKPFDPISLPLVERQSAKPVEQPVNYLAPKIGPPPVEAVGIKSKALPTPAVTMLQDQPEHVALSLATPTPGFVILSDHFYPGWQAKVDNVPAMMFRANVEARAVYVPIGSHLVEFDYQPQSLLQGFYCAAFGLFLFTCYVLRGIAPSFWQFARTAAGE